jgi:enediyne polyketide synthase
MGMEAMAQVFMALTETNEPPAFEQVKFERPVVVREGAANTIRVAALVRAAGVWRLFCAARRRVFRSIISVRCVAWRALRWTKLHAQLTETIGLDPQHDLYGKVLFHTGAFDVCVSIARSRPRECAAEIMPDGTTTWFGRYLPAAWCSEIRALATLPSTPSRRAYRRSRSCRSASRE